ncbi:MAG: transcriptional regulator TbsP [Halobacteriaceae archaeon]
MDSNEYGERPADVLERVVATGPPELYVVAPSRNTLEALVEVGTDRLDRDESLPELRVLADEGLLKTLFDDFLLASRAADVVEADRLAFGTLAASDRAPILVSEASVVAMVEASGRVGGLSADDDEFVAAVRETVAADWESADAYELRTPGISRVQETMAEAVSAEAREDFDEVLASMGSVRGDSDGIDEVAASLLAAARNRELLYDVSKWGEDVGLASKATFSRTKSRLENLGIIETEKVPIDVGRPRLRLTLADDRLQEADPDELANVAASALAS